MSPDEEVPECRVCTGVRWFEIIHFDLVEVDKRVDLLL
jgi:hypothetical protein